MPSNYTSNYNLNQWAKSDRVLMSEFNADNAKIDAALASKATTAALNSLKSTVTSQGSALDLRNCQVYFATHTGDGGANPVFSFPRRPWVVIFFISGGHGLVAVRDRSSVYVIGGDSRNYNMISYQFSGNTLTFPAGGGYVNQNGENITVFALLEL